VEKLLSLRSFQRAWNESLICELIQLVSPWHHQRCLFLRTFVCLSNDAYDFAVSYYTQSLTQHPALGIYRTTPQNGNYTRSFAYFFEVLLSSQIALMIHSKLVTDEDFFGDCFVCPVPLSSPYLSLFLPL